MRRWHGRGRTPSASDFARAYMETGAIDRSYARRRLSATELNEFWRKKMDSGSPGSVGGPSAEKEVRTPIPADKFGTLCHDAVEKAIETGSTEGYEPPSDVARGQDPGSLALALSMASSMARGFLESDFWKSPPPAAGWKSEKPFLLRMGEFLIKGRMDLYMETDDSLTILDFKSDADQDASAYAVQLDLYRRAAVGMAPGKPARIGIFWLRSSTLTWREDELSGGLLLDLARDAAGSIGHRLV